MQNIWLRQSKTFSPYLVPIAIVLYCLFPATRSALLPHMIVGTVIGSADIIITSKSVKMWHKITVVLGHFILFIPIVYVGKIYKPDIYSYILLLLAIGMLIAIPKWPYSIKRNKFIVLYLFLYSTIAITICANI